MLASLLESQNSGPPNPTTGILLIIAIIGAVIDSRYKRKGGMRSSERDRILFAIAVGLVVAMFVTLAILGADSFTIGYVLPDIAILLFALWEVGRWRTRRKNPLPKLPVVSVPPDEKS
jgi:drug/metabolite transporter (DMT)-like permease